jgi:ribosomal protein L7/L12
LGLKEAKEAVEKLPNILKAGMKKEEAETMKETL